jgi:REP element-mobilizing transposase RayT
VAGVPRQPRIEVPGGTFHVTTRGVNGEPVFFDPGDCIFFLTRFARTVDRFGWVCLAFCLMTNHYHFVIETPEPTLARGMEFLNGAYARGTNQRHGRTGHLFGRRYWSGLIETDSHLVEACRYVVLNPVRAGICTRPDDWRFSSHAATIGTIEAPGFLAVGRLLSLFRSDRAAATVAWERFVDEGRRG